MTIAITITTPPTVAPAIVAVLFVVGVFVAERIVKVEGAEVGIVQTPIKEVGFWGILAAVEVVRAGVIWRTLHERVTIWLAGPIKLIVSFAILI
jgi:hypothetical protein